jgi:hypothetical protein
MLIANPLIRCLFHNFGESKRNYANCPPFFFEAIFVPALFVSLRYLALSSIILKFKQLKKIFNAQVGLAEVALKAGKRFALWRPMGGIFAALAYLGDQRHVAYYKDSAFHRPNSQHWFGRCGFIQRPTGPDDDGDLHHPGCELGQRKGGCTSGGR